MREVIDWKARRAGNYREVVRQRRATNKSNKNPKYARSQQLSDNAKNDSKLASERGQTPSDLERPRQCDTEQKSERSNIATKTKNLIGFAKSFRDSKAQNKHFLPKLNFSRLYSVVVSTRDFDVDIRAFPNPRFEPGFNL